MVMVGVGCKVTRSCNCWLLGQTAGLEIAQEMEMQSCGNWGLLMRRISGWDLISA